jgi:regulatory protein
MTSDFKEALEDAIKLLAPRARLSSEIRAGLLKRGHQELVVEEVVSYLLERKLVNDNKTTKSLIERHSGKRSMGIERLRAELEKLGAPEEIVEANLAAVVDSEPKRALVALQGKYRTGADRAKAGRFLFGRGFREDAIESALDEFCGPAAFPE